MGTYNLTSGDDVWEAFQQSQIQGDPSIPFVDNEINALEGNDFVVSGTADDTINGGDGNDSLYGIGGSDVINGGNGDDLLDGGTGNDTLDGGAGNDQYFLEFKDDEVGKDHIIDSDGDGEIYIGGTSFDPNTGATSVQGYQLSGNALLVTGETDVYSFEQEGTNYFFRWSGNDGDDLTIWSDVVAESQLSAVVKNYTNGTFGLEIGEIDNPPIADDDSANVAEDNSIVINVLNNDNDDNALDASTVAIGTGPANGAVNVDPVTGEVTYTPNANYNGTDSFTYTVQDDAGQVSNEATVTVNVGSENDAPVATADSDEVVENQSVTINVLANDSDIDGTLDASSVQIDSNPSNGAVSVDANTGEITYTPNTDYVGSDSFTYTVKDNQGAVSNAATVSVNVTDSAITLTENPDFFEAFSQGVGFVPNEIFGLGGDDTIISGNANDTVDGGEGNDVISGVGGDDILKGNAGDDTLDGSRGDNTVEGGEGDDTFIVEFTDPGSTCVIDDGGSLFVGALPQGPGAPVGFALAGTATEQNDGTYELTIGDATFSLDWAGDETTPGDLTITALGEGNIHSVIVKDFQNDTFGLVLEDASTPPAPTADINGTDENDTLQGGNDSESIEANGGDDLVFARNGDDLVNGGGGDDRLLGGNGDDLLNGGEGDDSIWGGNNDDEINGGNGNDFGVGGNGDDLLNGGYGNDVLQGGNGDDVLYGGQGRDILDGGQGFDTFLYKDASESTGVTADKIFGFTQGQDVIDLIDLNFSGLGDGSGDTLGENTIGSYTELYNSDSGFRLFIHGNVDVEASDLMLA